MNTTPEQSRRIGPDSVDRLLDCVRRRYPNWSGFADPEFVKDEVAYKRTASRIAQSLLEQAALRALADTGAHEQILDRFRQVARATNLLYLSMPLAGDLALLNRPVENPAARSYALIDLLHGTGDGPERLERFVRWTAEAGLPNRWSLATYFLFMLDPAREMFVKPESTTQFLALLGRRDSFRGSPSGDKYAELIGLLGELRRELEEYGPGDMIDIQSLVWVASAESRSLLAVPTAGKQVSDEQLLELYRRFEQWHASEDVPKDWVRELVHLLTWIEETPESDRASYEFQKRLWNDNPVSAVGQGNVNLDQALEDDEFRAWLAHESVQPLSEDPAEVTDRLRSLNQELRSRLQPICKKIPQLKIYRVLAALFPGHLTTIADTTKMWKLYRTVIGGKDEDVGMHVAVLRRLAIVLGEPGASIEEIAFRITFPWFLYLELIEEAKAQPEAPIPSVQAPVPLGGARTQGATVRETTPARNLAGCDVLPAYKRRRGMTSIKGHLQGTLRALDFIGEGAERDEVLAFLQQESPSAKPQTLLMTLQVLQRELGVLEKYGRTYVLSEAGRATLEAGNADPLAPSVLTRVLGPDHVLVKLRDDGPIAYGDMIDLLKAANPGWTSGWAPSALLTWLAAFNWIRRRDGAVELTADGRAWAEQIDWTPERLEPLPEVEADDEAEVQTVVDSPIAWNGPLPRYAEIEQRLSALGYFDGAMLKTLHAGLWAHTRRHFAILTGLSGSGKTLLSTGYADSFAEAAGYPGDARAYRFIVAVQPGWTDPSPLFGYVNPLLQGDAYVRTPVLEFLLTCTAHPDRAFFLILDEMNLSHPEQYLAPLLSAMETADHIPLHSMAGPCGGVPQNLPYPPNLVVIGTVNMDETTHGLSDKILDRALTLEFWNVDLDRYERGRRAPKLAAEDETRVFALLTDLMSALAPARLHFGWRVVDEVLDFAARSGDVALTMADALDRIIYAKVLPKLRGDDSTRFRNALERTEAALHAHGLHASRQKVAELREDLVTTGTARFWR